MRSAEFESLFNHIGKHLIVTDGTTLLGADNKAGIAEILTAAEILLNAKEKHATVRIAFTPDEEIGRGADLFDVKGFAADYAYTVDGGALGELEYENFNAAGATAAPKTKWSIPSWLPWSLTHYCLCINVPKQLKDMKAFFI